MTLVTQFGGRKTHTLTALYHLVTAGETVGRRDEVADLLREAGLSVAPEARVAVSSATRGIRGTDERLRGSMSPVSLPVIAESNSSAGVHQLS